MNTSNRSLNHLSKFILLLLLFENASYGGAVKKFFGFGKKKESAPVTADDLSQPRVANPAPAQPFKQTPSASPAQSKPNSRSSSRSSSISENEAPNGKDLDKNDKGKKDKGRSSRSSRSSSTSSGLISSSPETKTETILKEDEISSTRQSPQKSKLSVPSVEDKRRTVMSEVMQLLSPKGLDIGYEKDEEGNYKRAQVFGKENKNLVERENKKGFALNSGFDKWATLYKKNEAKIISSESEAKFAERVNKTFRDGTNNLSHLEIYPPDEDPKSKRKRSRSPQRRQEANLNADHTQESQEPTLSFVDNGKVALLKVPSFTKENYSPFCMERLVQHAINSKVESMVVDFQANNGGRVENLNHFKMMFHPETVGTVFLQAGDVDSSLHSEDPSQLRPKLKELYQKKEKEQLEAIKQKLKNKGYTPPYFSKPLAVLVDRETASCAEDAATCLKSVRGARAYGRASTGYVLQSMTFDLSYGYQFQAPLAEIVTHEGERLQGKGVSVEPGEPPRVILDCLKLNKISDVLSEKSEVCSDGEPVDLNNKPHVRRYTCDDILKVDAKVTDKDSRIPLHYAAMDKDPRILGNAIQSHKTNDYIDFQDSVGKTPLHYAVQNNLVVNAELLLISGAKMNIKDKNGRTAYDYVLDRKPPNDNMVKLFVKYQDNSKSKSGVKKPTKRR